MEITQMTLKSWSWGLQEPAFLYKMASNNLPGPHFIFSSSSSAEVLLLSHSILSILSLDRVVTSAHPLTATTSKLHLHLPTITPPETNILQTSLSLQHIRPNIQSCST